MKDMLKRAMEYEKREEEKIKHQDRPRFHLSARTGWMNDPNGFSYYKGEYHLFYQYYPYDTKWGPMHWGHAVSSDLIQWTYLPAVLAPDEDYDYAGCFSGSAVDLPTGEQLLLYTGVSKEDPEDEKSKDLQVQCIAIGDGLHYEKASVNPVLTREDLPEGGSPYDFRDPKIWREEDGYYCVVGSCTEDKDGQILLYRSENGREWKFEKVLIKNNHRFGKMWECPDFFPLEEKQMLIVSPQEMLPDDVGFTNGNGTLYITGRYDADHNFLEEQYGAIDQGIDFYAPQTLQAPDGRRIMIGWLQNWDTRSFHGELPWFGQMSVPREITLQDGRLRQQPIRELKHYYGAEIIHKDVLITEEVELPEIEGRCVDLELEIRPADVDASYGAFQIKVAADETKATIITYDPYTSELQMDRQYSGTRTAVVHQCRARVADHGGSLKLRLLLDQYSIEAFINDGEQAMSMTIYTEDAAKGIRFAADGRAKLDVTMHKLNMGEMEW